MAEDRVGSFKIGELVESRDPFRDGWRGFIDSVTYPSKDGARPIIVRWHNGSSSSEWKGSLTRLVVREEAQSFIYRSKKSIKELQWEIDELNERLESKIRQRELLETAVLKAQGELGEDLTSD